MLMKRRAGNLPPKAHLVQLLRLNPRKIQARANRVHRKPRIVFRPADSFFRHRKHQLAVAHQTRRRIMHLRIINPKGDHAVPKTPLRLSRKLVVSPDDEKRMNLLHNGPLRSSLAPKKTVYEFDRPILRRGPAILENSRVVQNHCSAGSHKAAPFLPIALYGRLRVISINQKQIDRLLPFPHRILAEFFDPENSSARTAVDSPLRHAFYKIKRRNAAQMKWIDQIKRPVLRHSFAKRQRRNSLCNSDFNHALAPLGPFSERRVLGRSVLRDCRAQAQVRASGMTEPWSILRPGLSRRIRFAWQSDHRVLQIILQII